MGHAAESLAVGGRFCPFSAYDEDGEGEDECWKEPEHGPRVAPVSSGSRHTLLRRQSVCGLCATLVREQPRLKEFFVCLGV